MFIAEYEEEEEEEEGKEEEERQGLFKIPCSMKMVSGNTHFSQLVFEEQLTFYVLFFQLELDFAVGNMDGQLAMRQYFPMHIGTY